MSDTKKFIFSTFSVCIAIFAREMADGISRQVHSVIAKDSLEELIELEKKYGSLARIRHPDTDYTLMMTAAYHGSHDVLQYLISRGISPDSRCAIEMTPIMIAIFRGHENTAIELIAHTRRPDLQYAGTTALIDAVMFNKRRVAHALLKSGADPNLIPARSKHCAYDFAADQKMRDLLERFSPRLVE